VLSIAVLKQNSDIFTSYSHKEPHEMSTLIAITCFACYVDVHYTWGEGNQKRNSSRNPQKCLQIRTISYYGI
jgi:hypothetical protein